MIDRIKNQLTNDHGMSTIEYATVRVLYLNWLLSSAQYSLVFVHPEER